MSENASNKRKVLFTVEEKEILRWLIIKSFIPLTVTLAASCAVLFLGLQFAINGVVLKGFNLPIDFSLHKIPQFIYTYLYLAAANILLMLYISFVVMYLLVRNLVLPVVRITREIKQSLDANAPVKVGVRKHDKLLFPLVEAINRLAEKVGQK